MQALIDALQQNQLIFDYATQYYYAHSHENVDGFKLDPKTLREFQDFVTESDFAFETRTEKALKEALTEREDVIFTEAITTDFKSLLSEVEKQKYQALQAHSDEVQKLLEDEVIKRYFYRDGLYKYYLKNDPSIMTAREVLGDASRYRQILQ